LWDDRDAAVFDAVPARPRKYPLELLELEGNRAVRISVEAALQSETRSVCIEEALTHHPRK